MRRLALIFSLIAAPLWAQVQGVELDDPVALPDFHLENDRGETFDRDTLTGHWTLVMFGFLSCPDVCPFTLGNLEAAVTRTARQCAPGGLCLGRSGAGC